MVKSAAPTVDVYLAELPPERRAVISEVRDFVRKHLPQGYEEGMSWGMIAWEIPVSRYPVASNRQPLTFTALAAQKNNYALYLPIFAHEDSEEHPIRQAYAKAGKRIDMGKCCLRFKKLDDLLLEPIGVMIAGTPVDDYIARYEAGRRGSK